MTVLHTTLFAVVFDKSYITYNIKLFVYTFPSIDIVNSLMSAIIVCLSFAFLFYIQAYSLIITDLFYIIKRYNVID